MTGLPLDHPLAGLAASAEPGLPIHTCRPASLEQALSALPPAQAAFLRAAGFTASAGQHVLLPGDAGLAGVMLGLGEDRSPYTHAALPLTLPEGTTWHLTPGDFDASDATLGWLLGAYQFTRYAAPRRAPALLADATKHEEAIALARATCLARDLINTPANDLGPAELADASLALGQRFGATTQRIAGQDLAREYPMIAAVGAGSERPPVVAILSWAGSTAGPDAPLLSLCGKGVVFDTGGYDLKPSAAMLRMKKDMGGAALMLALASAIMACDLPLRLEVRIGCLENSVSGRAMRPGDILPTRKGLTVEIGNTDAEGRLLLCDLLDEAAEADPALLIDAATLTGAARVALGPDLPALFANADSAADRLLAEGQARHDPLWRLPLHRPYATWLSSPVADLNNSASKPLAGAITAALFLDRFVPKNTQWLHIDTYAWNDQSKPGKPEGGEALALRALFGLARIVNVI